ncbi:MAG: energy-coupling factor transporter transmembrane component T [Gemella haemolysans]|uniref:energy-coupling factor transporter transmembrane component T n=1 Tax=Gemella haemolysans TaxID=1379 RepID=UPI00290EB83A|nr:energy-coupling factor transporter transmembrane component T [Gemella haemolysans]MDU6573409.1 energy-coupling factor transporter transmembrane component T [Gemella haemolysans]
MLKLDIRTKIFILIIANILMFKMMSISTHLAIALCFSIYLGISSNFKRMIRFFGIYLFFTAYEVFFAHTVTLQVVDSFLLLTALMFKTLYFPLCAGMALVSSSKVSELICFLRSIRLPKKMIIVLAVLYRFFPVLLTDYKLIKNSLKMKGIGVSRGYYLFHPFKFFEYIFVPYVIISTNIANELSVSCLCRGIDNEEKPTSYIELKFNKIDYLVMVAVTIIFCFIMFMR